MGVCSLIRLPVRPVLNCEKLKVLKTDNFGFRTLSACYNMVLSTKLFVKFILQMTLRLGDRKRDQELLGQR